MQNKLQEMFELQDTMNSTVNPEWKNLGWNFLRALRMECSELIDMVGWKWWKKQGDLDIPQIQLELVDIWHFGMSHLIIHANSGDTPCEMSELARYYSKMMAPNKIPYPSSIDAIEVMIKDSFRDRFNPQTFMTICEEFHLDFDKLYEMYIAKNALNIFRQQNGYKEGIYSREWPKSNPTTDDNKILETIMEVAKQSDVDQKGGMFSYLMWQMDLSYNYQDLEDLDQLEKDEDSTSA
jgi:dimeric dUTPase (all-alpha-NTP-PPase superfamily)